MTDPSLLLTFVPVLLLLAALMFCDYRKPVALLWILFGTTARFGASDLPLEMRRFFAALMAPMATLQMWPANKAGRSA